MNEQSKLDLKKRLKNISYGKKYISKKLESVYQIDEKIICDDELFLLVGFHPNINLKNNIEYLVLRTRPPFNTTALYCKCKNSDSERDISYVNCIRNLFQKFDYHKNILKFVSTGMRAAIFYSDTRNDFYKNRGNICFHCEKPTSSDCHIDHYETPFVEIMNDFISSKNIKMGDIHVTQTSDCVIRMTNRELETEWVQYHDSRVQYKVSCALCNQKNGSYGYHSKQNPM